MHMGRAIVRRSSRSRLPTSISRVNPLDLNNRETVNGETKTPRRFVETERRRARGKLPLHYNEPNGLEKVPDRQE